MQGVLDRREAVERRVTAHRGAQHYLMRLLPYRTAAGEVDGVLVTFVDVSKVVETEAQLRTLVDELNHRVRNTLQVVTAVATQTLREEPSPPTFVQTFIGRLRALGVAHELVSRGGWSDVPLHDLVAKELGPYATAPDRVSVEGPPLRVTAKIAIALGMAVHELATNAAKHGALSAS